MEWSDSPLGLKICFITVAITPLPHCQTLLRYFCHSVYHVPLVSSVESCFESLNSLFTPDHLCIGSSESITHLLVKLPFFSK